MGAKLDQAAPIATTDELADYDAIIFGTPTRFDNMCAQMRNFLDQTGGLWAGGKLIGKVGSVFTSTGTQHGGQETTITSFHITLLHHGSYETTSCFIFRLSGHEFYLPYLCHSRVGGNPLFATFVWMPDPGNCSMRCSTSCVHAVEVGHDGKVNVGQQWVGLD